jgi:radical SAM superfamily enzyme YgiQ (UPF0313 family)
MKVALLTAQPNKDNLMYGHAMSTDEKRPPNGIGILYSILKKDGIDVEIYDRYCGDLRWPSNDFKDYDFVGIYCATVCTDDISQIINRLKSKVIAVGGPHASLFPQWFSDKVKYIVQGEGEKIITELVINLSTGNLEHFHYSGKNIITTTRLESKELDSLPRFPYEYFWGEKERYTWTFPFSSIYPVFTINSSRGCPFSCSFCSVKKIWGRKITYISAERVFSDIEYVKSLGAKGLYFREDNFTVNKVRLQKLCGYLIKSKYDLQWACETRADSVDEETVKMMSDAGCIGFYIGVESLSQHMLDVFNKGLKVDDIVKCFALANKYGIKTAASMIKGHPEETQYDINETRKLLTIIKPSMVWFNQYRSIG